MSLDTQKPSYEEWLTWTDVVIDRLSIGVKVYAHPPFDVVLIEKDQRAKKETTLDLLQRVYALVDTADTPTDAMGSVARHDEQMIDGLAVLVQEVLAMLPVLSSDMQKLLKSSWQGKCNGKVADEFFRGPQGRLEEGVGSGFPENGRLPAVLQALLEREKIGDSRQPREALHRSSARPAEAEAQPSRKQAGQRRWGEKGGGLSAGRIE